MDWSLPVSGAGRFPGPEYAFPGLSSKVRCSFGPERELGRHNPARTAFRIPGLEKLEEPLHNPALRSAEQNNPVRTGPALLGVGRHNQHLEPVHRAEGHRTLVRREEAHSRVRP